MLSHLDQKGQVLLVGCIQERLLTLPMRLRGILADAAVRHKCLSHGVYSPHCSLAKISPLWQPEEQHEPPTVLSLATMAQAYM
jgi:hypothetical protein